MDNLGKEVCADGGPVCWNESVLDVSPDEGCLPRGRAADEEDLAKLGTGSGDGRVQEVSAVLNWRKEKLRNVNFFGEGEIREIIFKK